MAYDIYLQHAQYNRSSSHGWVSAWDRGAQRYILVFTLFIIRGGPSSFLHLQFPFCFCCICTIPGSHFEFQAPQSIAKKIRGQQYIQLIQT
jgi:hypothetical protein